MNLKYLGDAKDWWKGAVLTCLRRTGAIRSPQVVPMFTDVGRWSDEDLDSYVAFLGIEGRGLLFTESPYRLFTQARREEYFEAVLKWTLGPAERDRDLFLDPDTGLSVKGSKKHVRPEECWSLVQDRPDKVVVVYQHGARAPEARPWEEMRLRCALDAVEGGHGLALASGGQSSSDLPKGDAALLFLSLDKSRIAAVEKSLSDALGSNAEKRILRLPTSENMNSK